MDRTVLHRAAPWLLAGFGVAISLTAAVWHLGIEANQLGRINGPIIAFLLDGLIPLALVYVSYRLVQSAYPGERIWTVFIWGFAGACGFGLVIGLSLLIQQFEGRTVPEPMFNILMAVDTGAIAGTVAGYYATSARRDADRAARAMHTLSFVNGLLRHDLRNSLTVIEGRIEILMDATDSARALDAANAIREQIDEIIRLAENAGAVAKTLSADTDFEPVDLAAVTGDIVRGARKTYDTSITVDAPDTAVINANDAIRPVVRNLIENAIEHNDSEEPEVNIQIENHADAVRLSVTDNGPGIPDEQKDEIFTPRAGETHGGGLHLVETLVDSFGGDIWVEDRAEGPTAMGQSNPGDDSLHGARFVVELQRR